MIVKFAIVFASLLFIGLAVYNLIFDVEVNNCSMTYMFEMPQYKKINIDYQTRKLFPKYDLYLYDEGDSMNVKNLQGIPVLFLPGNGGSYKQVRSLASVSLRMTQTRFAQFHFNYFSASFDEELTAFHGFYVQRQTDFTIRCIKKIFELYKINGNPIKKVILIGHSMGGFIARKLWLEPEFDSSSVDYVITMATPHLAPALLSEHSIMKMYEQVNSFWTGKLPPATLSSPSSSSNSLDDVALFSLSGGARDIQVWDKLSDVTSLLLSKDNQTSLHTLWMSTEWTKDSFSSTDHLCIVWCKEIIINTVRSIFDIEMKRRLENKNVCAADKINVFKYHFVSYKTLNKNELSLSSTPLETFPTSSFQWKNYTFIKPYFELRLKSVSHTTYYKVGPLPPLNNNTDLFISADAVRSSSWAFVCLNDDCSTLLSLKELTNEIPPRRLIRKFIHISSLNFPILKLQSFFIVFHLPDQMLPLNLEMSLSDTSTILLPPFHWRDNDILLYPNVSGHVVSLKLPWLQFIPYQIHILPKPTTSFHLDNVELLTILQEDPWNTSHSLWHKSIPLSDARSHETHVTLQRHWKSSSSASSSKSTKTPIVRLVLPMKGITFYQLSVSPAPISYVAYILRSYAPLNAPILITILLIEQILDGLAETKFVKKRYVQYSSLMAIWIVLHRSPLGSSLLPLDAAVLLISAYAILHAILFLFKSFSFFTWIFIKITTSSTTPSSTSPPPPPTASSSTTTTSTSTKILFCLISSISFLCFITFVFFQQILAIICLNCLLFTLYLFVALDYSSGKRSVLLFALLLQSLFLAPDVLVYLREVFLHTNRQEMAAAASINGLAMDCVYWLFLPNFLLPLLVFAKNRIYPSCILMKIENSFVSLFVYFPCVYLLFLFNHISQLTTASAIMFALLLESALPLISYNVIHPHKLKYA